MVVIRELKMCSVHKYSIPPTLTDWGRRKQLAWKGEHGTLKQMCTFHKTVEYLSKHKEGSFIALIMQREHVVKAGNISLRPASWVNLGKIPGHLYFGHCVFANSPLSKSRGLLKKKYPKHTKIDEGLQKAVDREITKSFLQAFLKISLCICY